jgi:hypothetical protein
MPEGSTTPHRVELGQRFIEAWSRGDSAFRLGGEHTPDGTRLGTYPSVAPWPRHERFRVIGGAARRAANAIPFDDEHSCQRWFSRLLLPQD